MAITQLFQQPRIKKKAFTYNVTTAAANQPLQLDTVKTYLKISLTDKTQDDLLNIYIDAATDFAEKYMNRDLINKTYTTFRDDFNDCFELRRSRVSSIASIKYLISDVLTTVATTVYGFTDVTDYSDIFLEEDQEWPTDVDDVLQAVEIIFIAGYGATDSSIPADIKIALLSHIAFMYENRGDCDLSGMKGNLPVTARNIYNSNRLINIGSCK